MKERVLEYLEFLSDGRNKDGVLDSLLNKTELSQEQIIQQSKKVKNSILHNYADLRISTIDKFTYTIIRTFSKDLGLLHNFELEMDNSRIIHPVVSNLLSKISINGGRLSDALVNFALQKLEDGKSYNIELDLEDFSEHLFKEQAIPFISSHNISVSQCLNLKDQLLQKKYNIFADIKQLSDNVIIFFNNHTSQRSFY